MNNEVANDSKITKIVNHHVRESEPQPKQVDRIETLTSTKQSAPIKSTAVAKTMKRREFDQKVNNLAA